jgi:multicomponent Na+:H+ antiporter subunit A
VIALLALHGAVGLVVMAFGERLGRSGLLAGALPSAAALGWLAWQAPSVLDGEVVAERLSWVPALDLAFGLRLDGFGLLMALLVSGIGVLVFAYGLRYFPARRYALGRLAGLLTLFAGAMLGLVVADNLLALYVFWELTSVTSFLLIGNDHTEARSRAAALQALLVTGAGGLALLGGVVLLGTAAGTYSLSGLLADTPAGTTVTTGLVLIVVGAMTKSALYPFHSWLPGAMVAPTPVSAYLHSATMVTAGVYLLARFAPVYATTAPWRPLVLSVGLMTMVAAGLRALRQCDLKLLLAFGTVSQLGFLAVLFGAGTPEATLAGCMLLLAHALFKAALFMVVGILDHQAGTRDLRELPPLGPGWAPTRIVTVLSAASMAAVPLTVGFVAKESAYDAFGHGDLIGGGLVLAGIVGGSVLTVAYAARFVWGAFGAGRARTDRPPAPPPGVALLAPAGVLAAATVVTGVFPETLNRLVGAAAGALEPGTGTVHLALWHGFTGTLGLSALTLALGLALFALRAPVARLLALGHSLPSGADGYLWTLRGLNRLADRVTGVVQYGSLPLYCGIILLTAAAVPGWVLVTSRGWLRWPEVVDTWAHVPVAALLVAAALAAATVRHRFSAALFLGVVGYGMAGLFVVQGDPDLALTQVAIETLATVLFVLALRRLPDRFERTSTPRLRALRYGVSIVFGVAMFGVALEASAFQSPSPVAAEMVEQSLPEGHGRNVVNVILVDFRGWDTLGEITVLAVAAIGAVALARAGRQPRSAGRRENQIPVARLVNVDVTTRVIFHVVLVVSLYLLFAGHNAPGGGFVGGLLAGAALTLPYIAGGIDEVRRASRFRPWTFLGAGVVLAAGTAALPLLRDLPVLDVAYRTVDLPVLGPVSLSSTLAFDTGVYLVVVGVVLMAFEAFGDEPTPEQAGRAP